MKSVVFSIITLLCGFILLVSKDRFQKVKDVKYGSYAFLHFNQINHETTAAYIDNAVINRFFKKHQLLRKYKPELLDLYEKRNFVPIWQDSDGVIDLAHMVYSELNQQEQFDMPYKEKVAVLFESKNAMNFSDSDTELLLSIMFIYYAQKEYYGLDSAITKELEWDLPRKSIACFDLLETLLTNPELIHRNTDFQFDQYYKLRDFLTRYKKIQQSGDWKPISIDSLKDELKPGDVSTTIGQIRHRLVVMGDLKKDSKSNVYDKELMDGILSFKRRNGYQNDYRIGSQHINRMNKPIEEYIKIITLNMERSRWVSPNLFKSDDYIFINIPAFKLIYNRHGKNIFESKIYVGVNDKETSIFSSVVDSIVFSPYWNVPRGIMEKELKPVMEKDTNYLVNHNFEWNNGKLRQRPGKDNALGLVKFSFPNPYNVTLHDTPYKERFDSDFLLFSHGCINMQKAKEFAYVVLEDDPDWPIERINDAMQGREETPCALKKTIPIHVVYFTAWVSDSSEINFYFDIYFRDHKLATHLNADAK